jgi:hypothetical protein
MPAKSEKVIPLPEKKKDIFTDTPIFVVKTYIHETHKTPPPPHITNEKFTH